MRGPGKIPAMVAVLASTGLAGAAEVTVLDGATLAYEGKVVRLWGVRAPEKVKTCTTSKGTNWPCGERAFRQLSAVAADATFSCRRKQADFVVCRAGLLDIGLLMVKEGLAYATQDYKDVEAGAREAGTGIWE